MEKYEPLGVVGEGSYGVVLKCRHRESGRTVAIKKFIDSEDDQNVRKIALREIRVLRKLRHENLVNLLEVFRRRKHLYLVFEFIDHTLLDEMDNKSHGLEEETCRKYVFQILRGLGFCHDNNIIHRDVKPENVLVSKNGIVKLCDFGFARNLCAPGELYTDYVATRWYRAPELLVGDVAYGKEVDIWAVGCLFAEMMSGEPLFPGDSDIDQLFLIAQCLGRLAKRHLSIMSRNSAFRGFQFPKSRHGSTASMDSMNTKLGKLDSSGGRSKGPPSATHRYSGNKSSLGQRRTSVEKSVFSGMFPSWTDEAIHFLTICLDPEPSARPSCNGLLRLPYFTNDNFPSRFMAELNTKLQLEGRHPIPSYSTRKKRSAVPPIGANVTSSLSPNHRNPGLQVRNLLYQTRTNLNVSDDTQAGSSSTTHNHNTMNTIGRYQIPTNPINNILQVQNDTNFTPNQNNTSIQQQPKFSMSRDQTFLVDRNPKEKIALHRRTSFGLESNISNGTPVAESRIPTLTNPKYSDDFLIKNATSTSHFSNSNSNSTPQYNSNHSTSKSTPNIVDEANGNIFGGPNATKDRRFSISQHPNQSQLPPQIHRKFSYSFPTPETNNSNPAEENKGPNSDSGSSKVFHHLPVTTLTFSMGPHTLTYKNGMGNGGVTNGFGYPYSVNNGNAIARSPNSSTANKQTTPTNITLNHKRSPSPPKTKPFSMNNSSSYFPQTQHFTMMPSASSTGPGAGVHPQPVLFHGIPSQKSIPVSVFGSSLLKTGGNSVGNNGEPFLPRMAQNHKGPTPFNNFSHDENSVVLISTGTSPTKLGTSSLPRKKEIMKWDQQNHNRKLNEIPNGARHFSTFSTNQE